MHTIPIDKHPQKRRSKKTSDVVSFVRRVACYFRYAEGLGVPLYEEGPFCLSWCVFSALLELTTPKGFPYGRSTDRSSSSSSSFLKLIRVKCTSIELPECVRC